VYTIAVKRDFVARHFLVGGNWGGENKEHCHHYQVEIQLEGPALDQHGFVVDIVDIEATLCRLVAYYQGCLLNDLPEFQGVNPSIEHFARVFFGGMDRCISQVKISSATVRVWEDNLAWAAYSEGRECLPEC
jgi:6-pyruvoyltetrahydropterin/6-carboxytetrahydropterin synthase